jgi:hypothetical protein
MKKAEIPELAGLEGFELWDRTVRAPAHKEVKVAFVSVRMGGNIGMNRAAYRMWGEPDACQVMYDPERRRIALKPCSEEEENSFDIGYAGNVQIPCKSLFDYYGVEIKQARRYHDAKVIDGVLIVDL